MTQKNEFKKSSEYDLILKLRALLADSENPHSKKYDELLKLLQIPEINFVMFTKVMECKHIFKREIADSFKDE